MEFSIARDELQSALYLTQGVVERRVPVPILSNVMLAAEASGVTVAATDQQVGVRRRCGGKVKHKGAATANGRTLYEIARELPEEEVTIRSLENQWLEIVCGKARFKVVGIDPREFPAMPPMPARADKEGGGLLVELPVETVGDMIQRTLFAVSTDETRVNLNGIFLEQLEDGRLRMVATDGHRLAMVTRGAVAKESGAGVSVILPRKGVLEVKRLLEGGGTGSVQLLLKAGLVHVACGPVELSMRLVEGEFPDYRQVLPSEAGRQLKVDADALQAALRRVALLSSEMSHGVRLAAEGGKLGLSSMNPERGQAEEEIEAEFGGEPLVVGFNARYLLDVLGVIAPGCEVTMSLGDELSPGLFEADDDADYQYVIMPMRL